jgi:16S rRNA (cytosine1402-N4)-methyltransferase
VAHRRERGDTPAGQHVPVLVDECLAVLAPRAGERGVDATLGWGGHAERLLERLAPGGQLLGLDQDPIELPRTEARLRAAGACESALIVRRTSFAGLTAALDGVGWSDGADFVLADLGVSSMQIDDPRRGFTFKAEGPLDMRMNPRRGLSAADWLARATLEALADAFRENDETHAGAIAEAIVARRATLSTTTALAAAVAEALGGRVSSDDVDLAVRRVFQAVRIAVNDELGALAAFLRQVPLCLRPGGRVAVLTFHSGEDRRVKASFAEGARAGIYAEVAREVVRASPAEQRANPRSRSAKLRWARKPDAV